MALQETEWAGWALPISPEGFLLHVSLYASDVIKFAETFLERTQIGQQRTAPRSLDALTKPEHMGSLEDRNRRLMETCFFTRGFAMVQESQEAAGVRYFATHPNVLRNDDLQVLNRLEFGTIQFFQWNTLPGPGARSVWVTAEGGGWFYVLSFKEAATAQSGFKTPQWILQAQVPRGLGTLKSYYYESYDFCFFQNNNIRTGLVDFLEKGLERLK